MVCINKAKARKAIIKAETKWRKIYKSIHSLKKNRCGLTRNGDIVCPDCPLYDGVSIYHREWLDAESAIKRVLDRLRREREEFE